MFAERPGFLHPFDRKKYCRGYRNSDAKYQVIRLSKGNSGYNIVGQIQAGSGPVFACRSNWSLQTDLRAGIQACRCRRAPESDFSVVVARKPRPGGIIIDPRKKILRMSQDIRLPVYQSWRRVRLGDAVQRRVRFLSAGSRIDGTARLLHFEWAEAASIRRHHTAVQLFAIHSTAICKPSGSRVWRISILERFYEHTGGQRDRAFRNIRRPSIPDDSYGAQAAAKEYLMTPFVRGRRTSHFRSRFGEGNRQTIRIHTNCEFWIPSHPVLSEHGESDSL